MTQNRPLPALRVQWRALQVTRVALPQAAALLAAAVVARPAAARWLQPVKVACRAAVRRAWAVPRKPEREV